MNTNIDMGGYAINNLKTPSFDNDAVNLAYLQANYMGPLGGEMKYQLSMGGKRIINLASPRFDYDAANAKYVEDNYVKLTGSLMKGRLSMGDNRISELSLPENINDAINQRFLLNKMAHTLIQSSIDNNGSIRYDRNLLLSLETITIRKFYIYSTPNYNGNSDELTVRQRGALPNVSFSFTHPNGYGIVIINANYKFGAITKIVLKYGRNMNIVISYNTLNI